MDIVAQIMALKYYSALFFILHGIKMSSRLEQLFNALSDIILEYCHMPDEAPCFVLISDIDSEVNSEEQIHQFDKHTELDELILIMENNPNKKHRVPLMRYLSSNIKLLRPHFDNVLPMDETTTTHLQQKLIQLIDNLCSLLNASKTTSIPVPSEQDIKTHLLGCYDCKSGNIIQKTLFSPLKISMHMSKENIDQLIKDIINENQCQRFIVENKRLEDQLKSTLEAYTTKVSSLIEEEDAKETELEKELTKSPRSPGWSSFWMAPLNTTSIKGDLSFYPFD